MINDIKKELLKEVYKQTNVKVNMTSIEQGVKYPCFFCEYVTNEIKTIATIDFLNVIDFDLIYFPNESKEKNKEIEDMVYKLNKIKNITIDNSIFKIENSNVEIVDDVLHYIIRVYARIEPQEVIEPTLNSIILLKEKIESISNLKVFYINGNLIEINNGFFVIEPSKTETVNISTCGNKDYEREIIIRYITKDTAIDIYGYLENLMDKVISEIKGKNGIYKVNYNIDISYDKEEYEELKIINYELVLMLTERKNNIWI